MAHLVGTAFGRALRSAAPALTKRFFPRHSKQIQSFNIDTLRHQFSQSRNHHTFKPSTQIPKPRVFRSQGFGSGLRPFSRSARNLDAAVDASRPATKSSFPDASSNTVAYWLLASAASVFGIVVFGGLTRLTESGLSITEWKPVTGSLPPMSEADWDSEFTKYRSSPEFHMLNSRMTLDEFKNIYWMEWIHRLWGRAVGLSFVIPAAYFIVRRRVSKPMMWRLGGIASLIGFQGMIGWWMVKSGLKDDLFAPGSFPRVSQYRLAAHLGTAFICYLAMVWNGVRILQTNKLLSMSVDKATSQLYALRNPALKSFKISVAVLAGLAFTTAMSGALVAGLDAGLIYNDFPYMGEGFTPPKSELLSTFYSRKEDRSDLWWRNALENPSLVQLDHRILATTTFTAIMALFACSRFSSTLVTFLPRNAKRGIQGVVGFASLQVILGISTLIYMVPIPLASAHQAGALALLTWITVLGSRVWYPQAAAKILQARMKSAVGPAQQGITASHAFPAIPKVKPNYGGEGPIIQAGASALVAGVVSLYAAQCVLERRQTRGSGTDQDEKVVFLRKQQAISAK